MLELEALSEERKNKELYPYSLIYLSIQYYSIYRSYLLLNPTIIIIFVVIPIYSKFMEWKQERGEEARKQIEELRIMEAEEYNELKIKLETEIQTLEQHLQGVISIYPSNLSIYILSVR